MNAGPVSVVPHAAMRPSRTRDALSALRRTPAHLARIPHSLVALIARLSLAATFWQSGQTKVQGFTVDLVGGELALGVPRLSESVVDLFRDEYALPWIAPEWAAPLTAIAEHVLPLLLLVGLATRLSALGLLVMTLVIQLFVYPTAYATHGLWATAALLLIARGPGAVSLDAWLSTRRAAQ
jgi:putative oxidoreductase